MNNAVASVPVVLPPSLLWPPGHDRATRSQGLSDGQSRDLRLDVLVRSIASDSSHNRFVRSTLLALVADPDVIAYRQSAVAELRDNPALRTRLLALQPRLDDLGQPRSAAWAQESPLLLVPPRVSDLEAYVGCVQDLDAVLAGARLHSGAWRALSEWTAETRRSEEFQALAAELPALRARLDTIQSITIGVNLDRDLRPASAALLDISDQRVSGPRTLLHRLLGRAEAVGPSSRSALHRLADREAHNDPLARDLQKTLGEVVLPVAQALERYARIHAQPLAALAPELGFVLGALRLAERLEALGLPTCLPRPSTTTRLRDAYNPVLALQLSDVPGRPGRAELPVSPDGDGPSPDGAPVVPNPIDFEPGAIMFITGPNRGGKTTYLRAGGLAQALFQAGIFVAAAEAEMAPVDAIITHFPALEEQAPGAGRLDDEARRLREMFGHATRDSLLLFNEPLTSTGENEALLLAEDVLRALRLLGARAIWVTHLHALAEQLDSINQGPGATVVSWVAGVDDEAKRTYHIRPGPPLARSHAATIAQQHGITFEQLSRQLEARGMNDPRRNAKEREE